MARNNWVLPMMSLMAAVATVSSVLAADELRANADGNLLQVVTPYGSKLYFGDSGFGSLDHYEVEIPIRDLGQNQAGNSGASSGHGNGSMLQPWQAQGEDQLILRANELYNRKKFSESLGFIDELLSRNPSNVRGWVMKGSLMHVMGYKDLAQTAWKRALELDPRNGEIQRILEKSQ